MIISKYNVAVSPENDAPCTVERMREFIGRAYSSHCGECTYGREGGFQLYKILSDLTEGKCKDGDIPLLGDLAAAMSDYCDCDLGRESARILLSSIENDAGEFHDHQKSICQSMVCKKYVNYYIVPENCKGCDSCSQSCPEDAISGDGGEIHVLNPRYCTKCGACVKVCVNAAVSIYSRARPAIPSKPLPVGAWRKNK